MAIRILKPFCSILFSPVSIARLRGAVLPSSSPFKTPLPLFWFRLYSHYHPAEKQARAMTSNVKGENGNNGDDGALEGEHNQWKFRAPYRIHEDDSHFHARYEGSCHCGRIHYQLSRERPLDAKYCHCTTCQKIHGEDKVLRPENESQPLNNWPFRRAFSMGCHLPQRGYQLHSWPSRPWLV